MRLIKLIEVEEPTGRDLNNWLQFWDCVKQTDEYVTFRFCPRPSHGGERLKGFEMILSTDVWTYESFYNNIMENEEFVKMYFKEYLYGYSFEKHFFKLIRVVLEEFEETPFKKEDMQYLFGKMSLPKKYEYFMKNTLVISTFKFDVKVQNKVYPKSKNPLEIGQSIPKKQEGVIYLVNAIMFNQYGVDREDLCMLSPDKVTRNEKGHAINYDCFIFS